MYNKILFLDFDGVLNSDEYCPHSTEYIQKCKNSFNPRQVREKGLQYKIKSFYELMSNQLVERLNIITNATSCKIVLSTSWRLNYYNVILDYKSYIGITGEIIDRTPEIKTQYGMPKLSERGREINLWLKRNPTEKYVILDDNPHGDCYFTENQIPYLIETDGKIGLTLDDTVNAIRILNEKD